MNINFFVEDFLFLKYIGCATAARSLYTGLSARPGIALRKNAFRGRFDLTHYHTFGPLALCHLKFSRGRKVLTAHSTPRLNNENIAFSGMINAFYPRIYGKFDHIITISETCRREIAEMLPDMPVTMIPNGIDRDSFRRDETKRRQFRQEFGIDDDRKVVLAVAQLTPRKGIYDFLKIAEMCPEITWMWVGGFPYGIFSKDYFKIHGLMRRCPGNIIFPGFVGDITAAYSGADVFFMPSYAETFGLVVLEALSCGLPVIARGIPEFREIFDDALIFFDDLSDVDEAVMADDVLGACAQNAREFTRPFDISHIVDSHIALYREVTGL